MILAKNLENIGTESTFAVLAEVKALEAKGKPMIHMSLGQPDFKIPKHVVLVKCFYFLWELEVNLVLNVYCRICMMK